MFQKASSNFLSILPNIFIHTDEPIYFHTCRDAQPHLSFINLQDRSDMILVPVEVHGMRLKASLDETQQIDFVLYCL